jgi:hypothetical protein
MTDRIAYLLGLVIVVACASGCGPDVRDCTSDYNCSTGTICQTCNHTCVYPAGKACKLDAPCPCGWSCRGGTCQSNLGAPAPSCEFNTDCPVDMYCNRAAYVCEFPMELLAGTQTCTSNADCDVDGVCTTGPGFPPTRVCAANQTQDCFDMSNCPTNYDCINHQCEHHSC